MAINTPSVGEMYRVTTKKNLVSAPDRSWVNTYELVAMSDMSLTDLSILGTDLLNFERRLSPSHVHLSEAIVSTWVEEPKANSQDNFVTVPYGLNGTRTMSSESLSLQNVLLINRDVASGRKGHLALRGVLSETDVNAPGGSVALVTLPNWQEDLAQAITATIAELFVPSSGFCMVMINSQGTPKVITGFSVGNVKIHKTTRNKKRVVVAP